MYQIKENIQNLEELNILYDAVGWGKYDKNIIKQAIENTYYSVGIYDDNKLIGYGRLIGDTICFMYIQNVMVLPEYQSKKIGTLIMDNLLKKVKELKVKNPNLRLCLNAVKNKEGFYKKFGFVTREEVGLGSGMIYLDDEQL